jgi:hypothetical protein
MPHASVRAAAPAFRLLFAVAAVAAFAGCASERDPYAGTREVPYENPFAAMSSAEREVALDLEAKAIVMVIDGVNAADPEEVWAWQSQPRPRAIPTKSPRRLVLDRRRPSERRDLLARVRQTYPDVTDVTDVDQPERRRETVISPTVWAIGPDAAVTNVYRGRRSSISYKIRWERRGADWQPELIDVLICD